jgi:hypothetical protein
MYSLYVVHDQKWARDTGGGIIHNVSFQRIRVYLRFLGGRKLAAVCTSHAYAKPKSRRLVTNMTFCAFVRKDKIRILSSTPSPLNFAKGKHEIRCSKILDEKKNITL